MNNLTNIIEGIVFASGNAVQVKYIVDKLNVSLREVNTAIDKLKEKYGAESGIQLLTFNGKVQFASNPEYKDQIAAVLTPIKEKEFTKTILECAALIAYKQPVTKGELEEIRQVSCDYAIHTLLELDMIVACGKKDSVGKPTLYATTDNFLKRFKLNSIEELPDYDELMEQISKLNHSILDEDDSNYLYKKDEYVEEETGGGAPSEEQQKPKLTEDGYELPDFLNDGEDDVIKID